MWQEILQSGSGDKQKKVYKGNTNLPQYFSSVVSVDCGFKPSSVILISRGAIGVTSYLYSTYLEDVGQTKYIYNGTEIINSAINITPTDNGFEIRQTLSNNVTGKLDFIAIE